MIVQTKEAAFIFGVSTRTMGTWSRAGCPKRGRGQWDIKAVLDWWLVNIHAEKSANDDEQLADAKRRYWTSKADREKLQVDKQRGELIDREDIHKLWAARAQEFKSGLYYLVNALPPLLEGKDQANMRAEIDRLCWDMLNRVCRTGKFTPSENYLTQ